MKKHNALIRLLRKNHVKTLFFVIKTTYFHAKKHQNLAKKIIPAHANGQACDRTFSWWKIKKKIKINAQKCWKTQSFNTFAAKMHWNVYYFRSKSCFFNAFSPPKILKCNKLITTPHVIGNMKNRIFCYEKTMETLKTRKNVLKTQCFNIFGCCPQLFRTWTDRQTDLQLHHWPSTAVLSRTKKVWKL